MKYIHPETVAQMLRIRDNVMKQNKHMTKEGAARYAIEISRMINEADTHMFFKQYMGVQK